MQKVNVYKNWCQRENPHRTMEWGVPAVRQGDFFHRHKLEIGRMLTDFRTQLLTETVPFWEARVLDTRYGGYFNCFTRTGRLYSTIKPGWFAGRTLYTFSELYHTVQKREEWLTIARAGRRYLGGAVYAGDGRFNQMMSREGKVLAGTNSIFTDHFAAKGLYAYIAACGDERREEDVRFARQLGDRLFEHSKNPRILAAEGISSRFEKHAVTFMNLIVALESRGIFENVYKTVLEESVQKSLYRFANSELRAPLEYVGTDGQPILEGEGRLIDPGHTMESLWFSIKAGIALGRGDWIQRAGEVLDWVIDRAYDEQYGGFFQHVDIDRPVPEEKFLTNTYVDTPVRWDEKIWWVQAEALCALAMSALYGENERHFRYLIKMKDYVDTAFRDRTCGEWYSFCKRDGTLLSDKKGFELKGPYHVPRCLMQLTALFESYLFGAG